MAAAAVEPLLRRRLAADRDDDEDDEDEEDEDEEDDECK